MKRFSIYSLLVLSMLFGALLNAAPVEAATPAVLGKLCYTFKMYAGSRTPTTQCVNLIGVDAYDDFDYTMGALFQETGVTPGVVGLHKDNVRGAPMAGANLPKLKVGDIISYTPTGGVEVKYVVKTSGWILRELKVWNDKVEASAYDLVVETCYGTWRGATLGYEKLWVVEASKL